MKIKLKTALAAASLGATLTQNARAEPDGNPPAMPARISDDTPAPAVYKEPADLTDAERAAAVFQAVEDGDAETVKTFLHCLAFYEHNTSGETAL